MNDFEAWAKKFLPELNEIQQRMLINKVAEIYHQAVEGYTPNVK